MRSSRKTLAFPLSGVVRKGGYRQQTRPYSAPWAVNVRSEGVLESRDRGGSRPGLTKLSATDLGTSVTGLFPVTYLDASGVRRNDLVFLADGALGTIRAGVATTHSAFLQTDDGDNIITDDPNNDNIVFDSTVTDTAMEGAVRGGRLYLADTVLKLHDPATGTVETVVASAGTVPTGQPIICVYRDRVILGGSDHLWYASRMGEPTDWDFGSTFEDTGRAVAGQLGVNGRIGEVVTALAPIEDRILLMATENSLWALRGDPATGRLESLSDQVGVVGSRAWALSPDDLFCFLSNDGVYLWDGRGAPKRFSGERVPDELRELDPSSLTINMVYDHEASGFHLFLTPGAGAGTHWFFDLGRRSCWPVSLQTTHQPLSAAYYVPSDLGLVVLGSSDGYVRYFDDSATDDDGTAIQSHILVGPVRIASEDDKNAMLAEIHGLVDVEASGAVTWRVVMGETAQEAAELAYSDLTTVLGGGTAVSVSATGTWGDARNNVVRPRTRGPWTVIWLSSSDQWAFEAMPIVARLVGRIR